MTVNIRYEEGVNRECYEEDITRAIIMGGCPICKGEQTIYITVKNSDPVTFLVTKVCHSDFVDALNKRLPEDIRLQHSA
jgi:hypothetical protein